MVTSSFLFFKRQTNKVKEIEDIIWRGVVLVVVRIKGDKVLLTHCVWNMVNLIIVFYKPCKVSGTDGFVYDEFFELGPSFER